MSLQLDARRKAMLEEMLRVPLPWLSAAEDGGSMGQPVAAATMAAPVSVRAAPVTVPSATRAAEPRQQPVHPPAMGADAAWTGIEAMDWEALAQAVSAAVQAGGGRRAVFGVGDLRPDWLVVGDPPSEEDEAALAPFAGDSGRLLDNMLAAVGASRQRGAYLTNVVKLRLPRDRNPEPAELAFWAPVLARQVQLLQPRVILAVGRFAVQSLLRSSEPIGRLRGQVHRHDATPVVVTFHPGYLLRNGGDKAKAWADLCLAQRVVRG
jgi:uracil-DNA glycosylase family 4